MFTCPYVKLMRDRTPRTSSYSGARKETKKELLKVFMENQEAIENNLGDYMI